MIKSIISLLLFSLIFSNCSSSKKENEIDKSAPSNYFKSIQLKKIVPGQGIGILKIEQTRKNDIFNEKYSEDFYKKNGIDLQFRNGDTIILPIFRTTD